MVKPQIKGQEHKPTAVGISGLFRYSLNNSSIWNLLFNISNLYSLVFRFEINKN